MRCGGAAKVVVVPESSVTENGNGVCCWAAHAGAMAWGSNNANVPSAAKRVRREILSIDLTSSGRATSGATVRGGVRTKCPAPLARRRVVRATAGILAWRSRVDGSALQLRDSAGLAPDFPRLVALCGCAD